ILLSPPSEAQCIGPPATPKAARSSKPPPARMPPNSEHPDQTLESPAEAKSAAPHPQKKPVAVQTKHQSIPYPLTPSDNNKIKFVKPPRPSSPWCKYDLYQGMPSGIP